MEDPTFEPNEEEAAPAAENCTVAELHDAAEQMRQEIQRLVIGQEDMLDLLVVGLLAGGHILLEGVPGIAKTLTAKLLAKTLNVPFSRIQFTPDMMPSDVTGTSVFNLKTSTFTFQPGPVFANIVLIDEINRAPAKTQAALFEVMEEQQVTIDGETYPMEKPFLVLATQNPIEQEGTYRLPEAQLDRFLFRIKLGHPSLDEEKQILRRFQHASSADTSMVNALFVAEQITKFQRFVHEAIHIEEALFDYIAEIVHTTRHHGAIYLGASPRASLAIMRAAKAVAAINNRDFITPDDIQYVAYPVLNHRIILTPEREMDGTEPEDIIKEILEKIEVPR